MKRIFSLIIALCLLFNVFYLSAYAVEEKPITEFCGWEYLDFSKVEDSYYNYAPSYNYKFSIGKQVYSSCSILNDLEKQIYDGVVDLPVGTLSFKISYSPNLTKAQYESIDFTKIMYAICLDHPEIFYYNGYGINRSYYPSSGAVVSITYNIGIKKHEQTNVEIYSASNIPSYSEALNSAFKSVKVDTSNRYNFVKSVHDYLCNSVTYVADFASCYDVYGALVNKKAVCQGYAETMKMFCDYYKIPCVCITGTGNGGPHMWNAVQMDDGKWYLLDITWDDQESSIYYDFFLVGLSTKDTYFGRKAFNVSHISDGSPYLPILNYSLTKYTQSNHNTAFKATYNSMTKNNKYLIRSFFDASDTFVYYNGMYIETDGITTNQIFKAPSGSNNANVNWTMVLIGDCNGDGTSDYDDYHNAFYKVIDDKAVTTAYDMAADADCDGVLDVIDLAIIERAVSGSNTDIKIE